jgi:hypothetical protein
MADITVSTRAAAGPHEDTNAPEMTTGTNATPAIAAAAAAAQAVTAKIIDVSESTMRSLATTLGATAYLTKT